jgi:hypothetical protein
MAYVDRYTRGKKAAVDWTALSENQHAMIDRKYLPADFVFRDPSKMKKTHYRALLEHWYKRQEDDAVDIVFAFKGYWDSSSESVITVSDRPDVPRKRSKKVRSQRRSGPPGIRKGDPLWPGDSGEEEVEGEDEEDEHEEEEEEESDDEKGDNSNNRSRRILRSKAQPRELPFSAPRARRAAFSAPKKTNTRKSTPSRPSGSKSRVPEKPARRARYPSEPPDLGPQFELPTTRSGKRKADDAGLQAAGGSLSKKGKKDTASSRRKVLPALKKKGRV